MDVNQIGNNLPSEEVPSSQETGLDNPTQEQGAVINTDQDDGRGYKAKYAEADRKRLVAEAELKTYRELMDKFNSGSQRQQQTVSFEEVVESRNNPSLNVLTQEELNSLNISNDYLAQLEETPEGKVKADELRGARAAAYQKQKSLEYQKMKDNLSFEITAKNDLERIYEQHPALGNPNSQQRSVFMQELDALKSGGYFQNDIVRRAFNYAKANNPNLFVSTSQERQTTRTDDLKGHTPGTTVPNNSSASVEDKPYQLTEKEAAMTNIFGAESTKVAARLKAIREANANLRR